MAGDMEPGNTGKAGPANGEGQPVSDDELARRRERLDQALAHRNRANAEIERSGPKGSAAGFATALKLSSEFIAAILVGAAIGWLIDSVAGISPWGMIVFLLLGFCAGILNVLRSAGVLAEQSERRNGAKAPKDEH